MYERMKERKKSVRSISANAMGMREKASGGGGGNITTCHIAPYDKYRSIVLPEQYFAS